MLTRAVSRTRGSLWVHTETRECAPACTGVAGPLSPRNTAPCTAVHIHDLSSSAPLRCPARSVPLVSPSGLPAKSVIACAPELVASGCTPLVRLSPCALETCRFLIRCYNIKKVEKYCRKYSTAFFSLKKSL